MEPLTCRIDTSSVNMTQIDDDNAGKSEENLENETVDSDQLSGMFQYLTVVFNMFFIFCFEINIYV